MFNEQSPVKIEVTGAVLSELYRSKVAKLSAQLELADKYKKELAELGNNTPVEPAGSATASNSARYAQMNHAVEEATALRQMIKRYKFIADHLNQTCVFEVSVNDYSLQELI